MARFGFDIVERLNTMRDAGVRTIDAGIYSPASPTSLLLWKDKNYPYRLPSDLCTFLIGSDGFSLSWTAQNASTVGRDDQEVLVGSIRVNSGASIVRLPLDADDVDDITSARARAKGEAALAATRRCSTHGDAKANIEHAIAAFALDSVCNVGLVALVYGGTVAEDHRSSRGPSKYGERRKHTSTQFAEPEVWFQDLACRWHFLADSFTNYFRMMAVHLGVLGWQQAFCPVGLSPSTAQWMRLFCPDRLLFDQLEWRNERAARKASPTVRSAYADT